MSMTTTFENVNCALFLFIAYQLRVCQPPANTPNAKILAEDDEFEIGNIKKKKKPPKGRICS